MTTTRGIHKSAIHATQLLTNFAVAWGFVLTPIYLILFGLVLPGALGHSTTGPIRTLPLFLPVMGLLLSLPGLLVARGDSRPYAAAGLGLILNAVPLALATYLAYLNR